MLNPVRCRELEANAAKLEQQSHNAKTNKESLEAAISAAELYMKALKISDTPTDKQRLDLRTKACIKRAEKLKALRSDDLLIKISKSRVEHPASTRKLTTRENIILLEGSKLNGTVFKPWQAEPADEEFKLVDGELWKDNFDFSLSETQLKHFAGWKRPHEALSLVHIEEAGTVLPNEATMEKLGHWDMVQDTAPDCSVVASFCVGVARLERGHTGIMSSIVYPFDRVNDVPVISPNGRYVLRLFFNGCWRRVEIDDSLPTSNSSRVLHVIDRSHPGLLWPAIIEKAYLKVRGGYDFPGSNSATDLAVLTGWIPQQIFLHDEDVDSEQLWTSIFVAFNRGEILCTLGTGKLGRREQQQLGLGAEHDYAVLDMKEHSGTRELLIKNPWADGEVWKGATKYKPHPGHESSDQTLQDQLEQEEMRPGTFWMNFNAVFQYFENIYVNWNPSLFTFREDIHFSWNLIGALTTGALLTDHPQFALRANSEGEVWVLLNRHFRTGDFNVQNQGKNGYVSIYLFDNHGGRVFSSETAKIKGPFVDSPNTLIRIQIKACETVTLVAVGQDLPTGKHNFTLSTFSSRRVHLSEAYSSFSEPLRISSAWTMSTAGGSFDSSLYLQNPQFTIILAEESKIAVVLTIITASERHTRSDQIHSKILIVASDSKRITRLRQRDIVANSGAYRRGSTVVETTLPSGTYTMICSTFDRGQLAKFDISLYTTLEPSNSTFRPLPSEDSGRFKIFVAPVSLSSQHSRYIAPISISRITKAIWKASLSSGSGSTMMRMTLEQGQGPYKKIVASSTSEDDFTPIAAGLRIDDIDLSSSLSSPQHGGLWLVIEQPSQVSSESIQTTSVKIEVLAEEKLEVGVWMVKEE